MVVTEAVRTKVSGGSAANPPDQTRNLLGECVLMVRKTLLFVAAAAISLFIARRGIVPTLVLAGAVGAAVGIAGGPLPH